MANALNVPVTGVNHLHAHLLSIFISHDIPSFPYMGLVVSGGHTNLFVVEDYLSIKSIGKTRDDAAGEAFDKVAKMLNLEYPGGPIISKLAEKGDPGFVSYPRARLSDTPFDFSFSGLKTSVFSSLRGKDLDDKKIVSDICASFQEAVTEVLVEKTVNAAKFYNISDIVVCGGVASNKRLRSLMYRRCKKENIRSFFPELSFCTDNASMVAFAGYYKLCAQMEIKDGDDVYSRSVHRWTV
jgi:N6-L-threonylcarbamoyladenine synthase